MDSTASIQSSALGTTTKSAAKVSERDVRLVERYELQGVARVMLPNHRVATCLRSLLPGAGGVGVYHSARRGRARYAHLMVCGSVWVCPCCSAYISSGRREELTKAVAVHKMSGQVELATYTFRHGAGMGLKLALGDLLGAQKRLKEGRAYKELRSRYGVVGAIKCLEVTWGQDDGWHPHIHELLFLESEADRQALEDELYELWSLAAAHVGRSMTRERGLTVRDGDDAVGDYIAKFGVEPKHAPWSVPDEMTRWQLKHGRLSGDGDEHYTPFDLLRRFRETGEIFPEALFREYAEVFKGRRQLVWSPQLRNRLGLGKVVDDEEIAAALDDDAQLLALLNMAEWWVIRRKELRGQVLAVARAGDPVALRVYVQELMSE